MVSCSNDSQGNYARGSSLLETNQVGLDTAQIPLESIGKMQFDQYEVVVYRGQTVVLRQGHVRAMPFASMGHNFVLLSNSIPVADFAKRAMSEKDYNTDDPKQAICFSRVLGGEESTEIVLNAPEVSTYNFTCSFPGH